MLTDLQFALLEGADGNLEGGVASVDKHHIPGSLCLCWEVLLVEPIGQGRWCACVCGALCVCVI